MQQLFVNYTKTTRTAEKIQHFATNKCTFGKRTKNSTAEPTAFMLHIDTDVV